MAANVLVINAVQLGTVPYALGLRLQDELAEARKQSRIADTLVLLEHAPVITLGRSAKAQHLLASAEQLRSRGVEVFECNRGGDVTFHGPGQLVGYPIFNIVEMRPKVGAVDYVRRLEEVLIRACDDFGIASGRVPGLTGVWTSAGARQQAKIAAIGVHISRGVTSHGFALNVTTDLDYFRLIVPCGIEARPVTSMAQELGRSVELPEVAEAVARKFGQVFDAQVLRVETVDALLGRTVGMPLEQPREMRALHGEETFTA